MVTVPLPLSIAVALIVPRIGLPASAKAPETMNTIAPTSARSPTTLVRRRMDAPTNALINCPSPIPDFHALDRKPNAAQSKGYTTQQTCARFGRLGTSRRSRSANGDGGPDRHQTCKLD